MHWAGWCQGHIAAIFIILATYSFRLILIFILHFHAEIQWVSLIADEDEPLFMSLVSDLFPNQVLEKTAYPELEAAIEQQVEESGLVYHPPWVLKLIQVGIMRYWPNYWAWQLSFSRCCLRLATIWFLHSSGLNFLQLSKELYLL